jgi:hypothetical protein
LKLMPGILGPTLVCAPARLLMQCLPGAVQQGGVAANDLKGLEGYPRVIRT